MDEENQIQMLEREILGQADENSEAALDRARRIVRRIAAQAERRADEIRRQAERGLAVRRQAERARALAVAELEVSREASSRREEFVARAFDEARAALAGWRERPDRDEIVARLVTEAVRALPGEEFAVELAPEDAGRWSGERLADLAGEVSRQTGRAVRLKPAPAKGYFLGGARVTSADGRTRADQTFEARLERLAEDMRRMICGELFQPEDRKGRAK